MFFSRQTIVMGKWDIINFKMGYYLVKKINELSSHPKIWRHSKRSIRSHLDKAIYCMIPTI